MAKFTFYSLNEDDSTYYDDVYQDFHPHVSDIYFNDEGTFTVQARGDFLSRVFYQSFEDGSGLCQKYKEWTN
jgi:hypothetical protein